MLYEVITQQAQGDVIGGQKRAQVEQLDGPGGLPGLLEDMHFDAGDGQLPGTVHAGRAAADDRHFFVDRFSPKCIPTCF